MKMEEHFALPVIDDYGAIQDYRGKRVAILLGHTDHECRKISTAAAHAINCHDELVEALEWYGEQARLARLIHSEGDAGRTALAADGGERARAILTKAKGE